MDMSQGPWRFMTPRQRVIVKVLGVLLLPWTISERLRERSNNKGEE